MVQKIGQVTISTSICLNLETICSAPNPRLAMFSSSCWGQFSQINRYKKSRQVKSAALQEQAFNAVLKNRERADTATERDLSGIVMACYEAMKYCRLKDPNLAVELGRFVRSYIDRSSIQKTFSKSTYDNVVNDVAAVLRPPGRQNQFKQIGRNDIVSVRYADGKVVTKKFKQLQADLEAGICNLVGKS